MPAIGPTSHPPCNPRAAMEAALGVACPDASLGAAVAAALGVVCPDAPLGVAAAATSAAFASALPMTDSLRPAAAGLCASVGLSRLS